VHETGKFIVEESTSGADPGICFGKGTLDLSHHEAKRRREKSRGC